MAFDGNELLFGSGSSTMGFTTEKMIAEIVKDGDDASTKTNTVRGRVTDFGKSHRRTLIANAEGYKQGKPLYWSAENKPSEEVTDRKVQDPVLTLQTTYRAWEGTSPKEDTDDLGGRKVYLPGRKAKGSAQDAFLAAVVSAGVRKVREGDYVEIVCTGEGKRVGGNRNISPPKLYEATYWTAANPPVWASLCDEGLDLDDVVDDGSDGSPWDE
jgi:hypothetical protein